MLSIEAETRRGYFLAESTPLTPWQATLMSLLYCSTLHHLLHDVLQCAKREKKIRMENNKTHDHVFRISLIKYTFFKIVRKKICEKKDEAK